MNVQLIAAMTKDGFIARNDAENSLRWTSKEDTQRFVALTKAAGVMVMGRKTFATIGKALKGRHIMVYSRQLPVVEIPGVEYTRASPRPLLEQLWRRGCPNVAICGGGEIYDLFLRENLVDQMFLTIEPLEFGSGIPLFKDTGYLERFSVEKTLNANDIGTVFQNYVRK